VVRYIASWFGQWDGSCMMGGWRGWWMMVVKNSMGEAVLIYLIGIMVVQ
jgi:hypothetical protein